LPKHLAQLVLHAAPNAAHGYRHHALPLVGADVGRFGMGADDASIVQRGVQPPPSTWSMIVARHTPTYFTLFI
jgi:hypothetical protein